MPAKIKKIIAREGLIILSFIIVALSTNLVEHNIVKIVQKKGAQAMSEISAKNLTPTEFRHAIKQNPKSFQVLAYEPMFYEWAQRNPRSYQELGIKYSPFAAFFYHYGESGGMFLLFCGYPLYCIIRFIIWAVRMLKTK